MGEKELGVCEPGEEEVQQSRKGKGGKGKDRVEQLKAFRLWRYCQVSRRPSEAWPGQKCRKHTLGSERGCWMMAPNTRDRCFLL